jgi:hypothetical protein
VQTRNIWQYGFYQIDVYFEMSDLNMETKMKMKMKMKSGALMSLCLMGFVASAAYANLADTKKLSETELVVTPIAHIARVLNVDDGQGEKQGERKLEVKIERRGNAAAMDEPHMDDHIKALLAGGLEKGMGVVRTAELIKGAPYSAEVISETIQKLSDGNVISNKTSSLSFRDSLGRIREEQRDSKGQVVRVNINESVDERISLNVKTKTATKMRTSFSIGRKVDGKTPEQMFKALSLKSKPEAVQTIELENLGVGGKNGDRIVVVKRIENGNGDDQKKSATTMKTMTVDVQGSDQGGEHVFVNNMIDESFSRLLSDAKWASKRQTKAMGNRDFDGVKAEGKLTSFEIPAGEIGNAQAILVTDESWTSPELQITVYSKHSDPRFGDRIYRLSNLKRGEIPAAMFTIPADYTVRDVGKGLQNAIRIEMDDKHKKSTPDVKIEKK